MRWREHLATALLLALTTGGAGCSERAAEPEPPASPETAPETPAPAAPEPSADEQPDSIAPPAPVPAPKPSTRPAPPEPARAPEPEPPPGEPGPQEAAPAAPLDLEALGRRLEQTPAIGLLTKLKLKNEFDDLVGELHHFHAGRSRATLGELRERYELLLMKVIVLIQDRDSELSRELAASREAIWERLADPATLAGP